MPRRTLLLFTTLVAYLAHPAKNLFAAPTYAIPRGCLTSGMHWQGTGDMGRQIRELDWSRTPLGPFDQWLRRLCLAVELVLTSRQPGYLAWGAELCSLYNDAFVPILGTKHPAALGQPFESLWPEIIDEFRPTIAAVLAGEPQHRWNA
jgi:hypothetical protein